jgi:hypothetical protein
MTITPPSEISHHLKRLAFRLRVNKGYMASILAVYQEQEKLDEIELSNRLSVDVAQMPRLALCKRPLPEGKEFTTQVKQLAAYVGANEIALAQMIRQVITLEQFNALPDIDAGHHEKQTPAFSSGLLAAARDREDRSDNSTSEESADNNDEPSS